MMTREDFDEALEDAAAAAAYARTRARRAYRSNLPIACLPARARSEFGVNTVD
jgi:hypothetical protein